MQRSHTIQFSSNEIERAVAVMAGVIDGDAGPEGLVVVTVLKGAAIFSSDLVRAMSTETELVYVSASSYSGSFTPGETMRLEIDLDIGISGRDVLIVDDIVDTGRTLSTIADEIEQLGARRVRTAALIDKTVRRVSEMEPTYTGFRIGTELIYGYGLDWDERYRDLPFIARVETEPGQ